MPFTKLQFRPGLNREATSYSNEGGWYDCDKVRFRFGFPEKIGGWEKLSGTFFLGTCRALHPWSSLAGEPYLGVGTHLKYYINEGGGYNDITPIRLTTAAGDVTFAASADTLNGDVEAEDLIISLTSTAGFPQFGIIKINDEIIEYRGISGGDLTDCVRGIDGTTAAAHTSGDAVNCSTVIVSSSSSGTLDNDFVTYTGAVSLGGAATADILNQEYQVWHYVNQDEYYINLRTVATLNSITTSTGIDEAYVFATAADTGNGGSSVVGAYQVNTGLDTTVSGTGWGAGLWSRGAWGSAASLIAVGASLRIWSHDNFGEDLLINVRDGGIYYWDKTNGVSTRAVELSSLAGANKTPTIAKKIMVSNADRHILAFGCDSEFDPGVQDPLLIRFSSQESLTDWETAVNNTAGELKVGTGSEIITAMETRQQILVFTNVSLHVMQYLGPPFTFGIDLISQNISIASPLAAIAVEDNVYWMGQNEFYVYGGAVQELPCSIRDYVFSNINKNQAEKITSAANTAFSEIWWFYPSVNSDECDSYVVYNYGQDLWYYGTLDRTVWVDRGVSQYQYPIAASTDHALYYQEFGFDDGSQNPKTAISSYIESSQMSLGNGDDFAFLSRVIPDLTFRNSTSISPSVTFTVKTRNFPGGNYLQSNDDPVSKTASSPVEQYTNELYMRLRGRSFAFRIDSSETGVGWRLGTPRIEVRQDGRR